MKIGMTLPGMDPGLDRKRLFDWTRRIEAGPFDVLAFGERMAFYNPELVALFGACAALTERVVLRSTVIVMPIHSPVMLAKQLATLDVLSEGRLSVGLGIGGRDEDLVAVGADPARKKNAALARDVETMKRIWRGEAVVPGLLRPVEPKPFRAGGPELLAGAMGPKAVRLAASWADGLCGFTWAATPDEVAPDATLRLTCRLNGLEMQSATTDMMMFDLPYLVSHVSTFTTLEPGDVIVTGTPAGVGLRRDPQVWMKHGDVVEVELEGVGVLRNPVVKEASE